MDLLFYSRDKKIHEKILSLDIVVSHCGHFAECSISSTSLLTIPSSLHSSWSSTHSNPHPSHGQERSKTKEDFHTDGTGFSSGRKKHPKQGGSTYRIHRNRRSSLPWVFWGGPICRCRRVDSDGGSWLNPSRWRDQTSSVDSPLFKSISKASYRLLYGWGVNWCDWPQNVPEIHVAIHPCRIRSWACCGKHEIFLFYHFFEFNSLVQLLSSVAFLQQEKRGLCPPCFFLFYFLPLLV